VRQLLQESALYARAAERNCPGHQFRRRREDSRGAGVRLERLAQAQQEKESAASAISPLPPPPAKAQRPIIDARD